MPNIHEIKPDQERIDEVQADIRDAAESLIAQLGSEVGGYAFVAWGLGGRCVTAINCKHGLVYPGLAPTLAHDALQRHAVIDMVESGHHTNPIKPPDGAA